MIISDIGERYESVLQAHCDVLICADGKYAPCQGCFGCWTRHPAECFMKDRLQQVCRTVGKADLLTIVTENFYGSYSPNVKTVLDRSIGLSTPLSTWRGKQMHHTLRYGKHRLLRVIVYGDITKQERETFALMAKRNAVNDGYEKSEVIFLNTPDNLENVI
ncbi:MAG: NAD(P)H-dependent oxidoreductase [Clostridiales bacterium]|nr:NAD(P)H-dependent oxidoreductase [Clostridiales bacterium]